MGLVYVILIYTHIPKTGGNTFAAVLYNQYHYEKEVCSVYLREHLPKDVDFDKIKLIIGHHQFGLHKEVPRPCKYITMLRDPVDRVVSNYFFNLKFHGKQPKESPFVEFIKRYPNRQTRWVAGEDREDLQLAKDNIEKHFIAVGITEMFNESMYMMKQKLGWGDITYKQYNVNPKRPKTDTVSDALIDLIKKHNALDIELYHWAKRRFEDEMRRLDHRSQKRLDDDKHNLCKGISSDYANPNDFI